MYHGKWTIFQMQFRIIKSLQKIIVISFFANSKDPVFFKVGSIFDIKQFKKINIKTVL